MAGVETGLLTLHQLCLAGYSSRAERALRSDEDLNPGPQATVVRLFFASYETT
jgi:hypothetical protein